MSARPLANIETDIDVTAAAIEACQEVVRAVLAERYKLLSHGWPTSHALCEALDADAARWAAQAEHQRHAFQSLMAERDDVHGRATVCPHGHPWGNCEIGGCT